MKEDSGVSTLSSDVTGTGTVYIRINIPEISIQKCLQFKLDETVWKAKQRVLATFAKDLRDGLNYGFYCPPINGRAGKFLDEERLLREYPLKGPIGFLEFKYKRRVYKLLQIKQSKIKQLHTKAFLKEFIQFVKHCYVEKIQKATQKGLDPNYHDEKTGETPLTLATTLSAEICAPVLMSLANGGAHLDFRNIYGLTPMHKAAIRGNSIALKTLLDLGGSPNYKDGRGLTPLYYSVGHDAEVMGTEMLLHERAMVGTPDEQGWFELHHACRHGRVQHLELLVFYGANMNVQNASGNTPLHVCAVNNQDSCARVLLFRGARKDVVNFSNQTAYQVAIISNNHDLATVIQSFKDTEIVPFRELPTYSKRRQFSAMTWSMRDIMRSRSDPRINILTWEDKDQRLNESTSDGSGMGYHSDSPRHSISSGSSSEPVAQQLIYSDELHEPSPQPSVQLRGRSFNTMDAFSNGYIPRRASSAGEVCDIFSSITTVDVPKFENHVRTVDLQKGREGYGFVLRGAKSQNTSSPSLEFEPSPEYPALQYLDSVDTHSTAEKAGLKSGDFILEINNQDVIKATHEHVVDIIKGSGNMLRLKVVTVIPVQQRNSLNGLQSQSMTMPSRGVKVRAPMPPKRDPGTSLSYSKARSRSFADGIAEIEKLDETLAKYDTNDSDNRSISSSMDGLNRIKLDNSKVDVKIASIRSSTAAKRVSLIKLDDEYSLTSDEANQENIIPPGKKCSPAEMRIHKYHKKQNLNNLEKSSSSPNVTGVINAKDGPIYATPTVIDGYGTVSSPGYHTMISIHPDSPSSGDVSSSSSNQYSATNHTSLGVNSALDTKLLASGVSTNRNGMMPKAKSKRLPPGPPPPGHINIPPPPRKPAPQPPAKMEVVPINTTSQTTYANISAEIQQQMKASPYESSFRPGTNAHLTASPKDKVPPKNASMSVATGRDNKAKFSSYPRGGFKSLELESSSRGDTLNSEKHSVSFAEDKVMENAATFVKSHPHATLLISKQEHFEPIPDYDVDSDSSDIPESAAEMQRQTENKRSVENSPNRMIVKPDIHVKPDVSTKPETSGPRKASTVSNVSKTSVVSNVSKTSNISVKASAVPYNIPQQSANIQDTKRTSASSSVSSNNSNRKLSLTQPESPPIRSTPPTAPPPPAPAAPPPPPTFPPPDFPPSRPSPQQSLKQSPQTQVKRPGASEIARAVELRQQRLANSNTPTPTDDLERRSVPSNKQSEIQAAVARRRKLLENAPSNTVVNDIESRLNRTKKLQSAKFNYPINKTTATSSTAKTLPVNATPKLAIPVAASLGRDVELNSNKTTVIKIDTTDSKPVVITSKASPSANTVVVKSTIPVKPSKPSPTNVVPVKTTQAKTSLLSQVNASKQSTTAKTTTQIKPVTVPVQNSAKPQSPIKVNVNNKTPATSQITPESPTKVPLRNKTTPVTTPTKILNTQHDYRVASAISVSSRISSLNANLNKQPEKKNPPDIKRSSATEPAKAVVPNKTTELNKTNTSKTNDTQAEVKMVDVRKPNVSQANATSKMKIDIQPVGNSTPKKSTPKDDNVKTPETQTTNSSTDFLAMAEKARLDYLSKKGSPTVNNNKTNPLVNGKATITSTQSSSSDDSVFRHNEDIGNNNKTNGFITDNDKNMKLTGVTVETSSSDNSILNNSAYDGNVSSDSIQIEIIPPPMNFAGSSPTGTNISDLLNTSAFSHDDSGSVHSSLSTLSTLSSEQGDVGHNINDFIVPPPPPAFGDITEEDSTFIPPPPMFQSNGKSGGNKHSIKSTAFATKNIKDWSGSDVMDWLDSLGHDQYKHSFRQQMIDGKRLVGLSRNDYIDLGITKVGHRMNIERTVKKLAAQKS